MTTVIFRVAKKQSWDSKSGLCSWEVCICPLSTQPLEWLPSPLPAPVLSQAELTAVIPVALGSGSGNSSQENCQRREKQLLPSRPPLPPAAGSSLLEQSSPSRVQSPWPHLGVLMSLSCVLVSHLHPSLPA